MIYQELNNTDMIVHGASKKKTNLLATEFIIPCAIGF